MEVILNVSTYIAALTSPSIFSAVYLLLAAAISTRIMVLQVRPAFFYYVLLTTAIIVIGIKVVLLALLFTGNLFSLCPVLRSCGFDCSTLSHSWFACVYMFVGDFPQVFASLGCLGLKPGPYKKSVSAVERYWAWLVLTYFALVGVAVISCSFVNFIYLILSFVWALVGTYRSKEYNYLVLCGCTVFVSVLNIFVFYVEEFVMKRGMSVELAEETGLDYFSVELLMSDVLIVALLYLAIKTFQLSWYRAKVNYNLSDNPFDNHGSAPRSPVALDPENRDPESESSLSPGTSIRLDSGRKWSWYKALGLLFFILRVLVTLWIVYFMSFLGLIQMFWLFKSIIVSDSSKAIRTIPRYILPTMILQTIANYVLTILEVDVPQWYGVQRLEHVQVEMIAMIATISLCFLCCALNATVERALLPQATTSVSSLAITILLQNSDKAALCILFGVGLSKINVIHNGLMVLCLLFALKPKTARNHWMVLVAYTMLLIALPYAWILLLNVTTVPCTNITSFIGLPDSNEYMRVAYVIPPDYLSWSLLLAVAMQLSAYRSMGYVLRFRDVSLGRVSRTYELLLQCITKCFRIVVEMQVWVVYCLILLIVMLSELNILNYVRFAHIVAFIVLHLHCGNESISRGYQKVKDVWVTLAYYSGALLVTRYIYQFCVYYPGDLPFKSYLEFVGLRVYTTPSFYEAMVGDVLIFIISVFTTKSFHTESRIALYTGASVESSYSGEGGVLYELLRADAGNRDASEQHYHALMKLIAEPFAKVLMLVVALLAFYWRLSGVTWLMLTICGLYTLLESAHQHYLVRISN